MFFQILDRIMKSFTNKAPMLPIWHRPEPQLRELVIVTGANKMQITKLMKYL